MKYKTIKLTPIDMELLAIAIDIVDNVYELEHDIESSIGQWRVDRHGAEIALQLLSNIMYDLGGGHRWAEKMGYTLHERETPWLDESPPELPW